MSLRLDDSGRVVGVKRTEYLKLLIISVGSPLAALERDIFKLTRRNQDIVRKLEERQIISSLGLTHIQMRAIYNQYFHFPFVLNNFARLTNIIIRAMPDLCSVQIFSWITATLHSF